MSGFDELRVYCKCGQEVLFQSKAGECTANIYNIDDVPSQIAGDLHNDYMFCPRCKRKITILTQAIVNVICTDIGFS